MSEELRSNRDRVFYWIFDGLLTAQMLVSVGTHLFNHDMVREAFIHLS